jgi:signal transduction histidine kinase
VKNAIQAIPSDRRGKIIISLYEQGLHAVIKVSDNGIGIPDEMKNKVFTPNFTTKSSGTGLGLAISANIIDGFNGKLYFDTEVGIGTNFFVEIPLMRLEEQLANGKRRVVLE